MDNKEKQPKSAFLDTNIWIELLALRTPQEEHEKKQSAQASALLKSLLSDKRRICSCYEQLIEIVNEHITVRREEVEETKIETNGIWRGSIRATTPEGTQTFMSDGNRNYTATFFCKSNAVKLELDSIEGDLTLSVRGIKDRA